MVNHSQKSMESVTCQICQNQDTEDISIVYEMLKKTLQEYFEANLNLNAQIFDYVFRHIQFRKSLALIFDLKYLEILECCTHSKLTNIFLSLWQDKTGPQEKIEHGLIDSGLENLYQQVVQRQELMKQSRERFDALAQDLFNCEDDDDGPLSSQSEFDESDKPEGQMKFNKNSNKNKFQKRSIDVLKKWFLEHLENPYPDHDDKNQLSMETGMHVRQVNEYDYRSDPKLVHEFTEKKFEAGTMTFQRISPMQQPNRKVLRPKNLATEMSSIDRSNERDIDRSQSKKQKTMEKQEKKTTVVEKVESVLSSNNDNGNISKEQSLKYDQGSLLPDANQVNPKEEEVMLPQPRLMMALELALPNQNDQLVNINGNPNNMPPNIPLNLLSLPIRMPNPQMMAPWFNQPVANNPQTAKQFLTQNPFIQPQIPGFNLMGSQFQMMQAQYYQMMECQRQMQMMQMQMQMLQQMPYNMPSVMNPYYPKND